jgi:sensor histidine kinase YesM
MKWHKIIFSNRAQYRFLRHAVFWLCCCLFFQLSYWFPTYWFPEWNTHGIHSPVLQGPLHLYQKFLLIGMYALLCMFFMMFFTYGLVYFLSPRFLLREKYAVFAAGVVVLLLITVIVVYYLFVYVSPFIQKLFGWSGKDPRSTAQLILCAFDITLFNCPTFGGIALLSKLLKNGYIEQEEAQQLIVAKSKAELQLLKAQVHPHFLFNTLNNIYSFILTSSPRAAEMVKKLSGLLRYIIHECNQTQVALAKELQMIQDYISLETIRYGDQFDITIDIKGDCDDKNIAPLLLLPFAENSFKHGTSKMLSKPWMNLNIIIEGNKIYFMLHNSKPQEYINPTRNGGIGLENVQKRLQLLYPGKHELKMTSEPEHFTVLLEIDLQPVYEMPLIIKLKKENEHHEMA